MLLETEPTMQILIDLLNNFGLVKGTTIIFSLALLRVIYVQIDIWKTREATESVRDEQYLIMVGDQSKRIKELEALNMKLQDLNEALRDELNVLHERYNELQLNCTELQFKLRQLQEKE